MSRRSESVWQGARGNGLGSPPPGHDGCAGAHECSPLRRALRTSMLSRVERRSRDTALHVMDRLPIVLTLEERGSRGSVAREGGVPQ